MRILDVNRRLPLPVAVAGDVDDRVTSLGTSRGFQDFSGGHGDDAGRAYLFRGFGGFPGLFTADGPLLDTTAAHFVLASHFPHHDTHFGMRVAPLFDITYDGVPELRILSLWHDGAVMRELMHVFDGSTGELLFIVAATDHFDPWRTVPGDVNGDGVVDANDLLLVIMSLGAVALHVSMDEEGRFTVQDGERREGTVYYPTGFVFCCCPCWGGTPMCGWCQPCNPADPGYDPCHPNCMPNSDCYGSGGPGDLCNPNSANFDTCAPACEAFGW